MQGFAQLCDDEYYEGAAIPYISADIPEAVWRGRLFDAGGGCPEHSGGICYMEVGGNGKRI